MQRFILSAVIISAANIISGADLLCANEANDEGNAVTLVFNFPRVKAFQAQMRIRKQPVQATAERQSKCIFNVRIFEDHPDHIATFGFFDADICRKKVTEEGF